MLPEPLSRIERFLYAAADGSASGLPDPLDKIEQYLYAIAAGVSTGLPEPLSKVERYLYAKAAGVTSDLPEPLDRIERYLYAIAAGDGTDGLPDPLSRVEQYLYELADAEEQWEWATESGAVVSVDDAVAGPVQELIADINPVQDLHGYSKPWAPGAGKNLLPDFTIGVSIDTKTGEEKTSEKSAATDYIPVDFATNSNYYISGMPSDLFNFVAAYNSSKEFLGRSAAGGTVNRSISSTSFPNGTPQGTGDVAYLRLTAYENQTTSGVISEITSVEAQLEIGSAATTYTPYANVCPITGHTSGMIIVSPTENPADGTIYLEQWQTAAGTVYGGTVDAVSGTLTATHGVIASYNGETLPGAWMSSMDEYAAGTTPTTGAQVVYELAESVEYQLSPMEIETLAGTNNIWSSTGNVSVTYMRRISS